MSASEVTRVLVNLGFEFLRQRGSHRIYSKNKTLITAPMHTGDLRKGTLHQIIKQTGLSVEEFLHNR